MANSAASREKSWAPTEWWSFDPARNVSRFLASTPLLWVLGLNVLLGGLLTLWLVARRWPMDRRVNVVFGAWCLVAVAQAAAVLANWAAIGEPLGMLPGRLFAFTIVGWIFLGLAICAGHAWRLAGPHLVRGVMLLAVYVICGAILSFTLAFLVGVDGLEFKTPTGTLLGSSPTVDFYTNVTLFLPDPASFGLPRLVLFYPWSTALGFAGICMFLIATCERNLAWRLLGRAGGLVGVVLSFSRATIVILPVAILIYSLIRARPPAVLALLGVGCAVALGLILFEANPVFILNQALETMRNSRAGSSQARDLIYEYSWQGFLDSPALGHGWIGESVIKQEMLPVGSHSTFFGTLYTGGLVTFVTLVAALLLTFGLTAWTAIVHRTREAAAATAALIAAVMFSYGEGFYNMVLPCLFVFYFVGGALAMPRDVDGAWGAA